MKEPAIFKIALFHTGNVFAIQYIIKSFLAEDLLTAVMGAEELLKFLASQTGFITLNIISLGAIFVGILYSQWNLKKHYIIKDKDKVVSMSTAFFVALNLVGIIVFNKLFAFLEIDIVSSLFSLMISTAAFYWLSKKFLKNTETNTVS
ncbi:hypothetical protein KAR26_02220 [Candidatus Parcubacteria bacterium]|nr:hypothetical protein [Candidatus Parcubacteria bacterium]